MTGAGIVVVRVTCPSACKGTLVLTGGGIRLGTAPLRAARAGSVKVAVRLGAAGRRLVRTRASVRARAVVTVGRARSSARSSCGG